MLRDVLIASVEDISADNDEGAIKSAIQQAILDVATCNRGLHWVLQYAVAASLFP